MISRPTHWRTGPNGRESVAAAGEVVSLERLLTAGEKSGRITSRPERTDREIEVIAYRLGMTVAEVRRAIARGRTEIIDG
jgi:predicted deacylase